MFLLFYLFCWFDLDSILFYSILFFSILFYFISNWFDLILFYSILFYWIWLTILFSIVSHINEWFVSICPSVRPSVCLSVCVFICMNKFMFSLLSCFFILSLLFLFSFFSYERLPHTHTDTDTDTRIHMNICSFLWLVHITSKDGKWWIVFEW